MAGAQDVVIAGGVEMMSRAPMGSARQGKDAQGERYPDGLVNQGVAAELIGTRWGFDRTELDKYAATSHARAASAQASDWFDDQILPIHVPGSDDPVLRDEIIHPSTTLKSLAGLKPSFYDDTVTQRFPEISWSITPGNSSLLTDGASAVMLMSESRAKQLGIRPLARFVAGAVVGSDPRYMLTGPIAPTRSVLAKAGLDIADIAVTEVNEAFASVPAWAHDLGVGADRLNVGGGAIALGHPLGRTGTKLIAKLVHHLQRTGARYGLQAVCEGGGMANATIIERAG